ncbi:glutamate receptor ionotropic, kainate glr-3-like [Oratosquilla oratoria]|uniref:glutamate receptor ionotropic, kainate glr-3-like n=1 Tax=Oratosquilla oratoria TaxID=337810 RepID=UPI003F770C5E
MVGMLTRNESDVIVAPLDHVTAREEVIDYTIGIAVIGYQLLIKRPGMSDSMWTAYILVFSDGVWVSLLVSLALSLVVLVASVNYSPFESKTRVSEIAMIPIYAVSQQGWFSDVTARSCRIAYITLYLTTTLSYAAYTSTLTSALATQKMTLPFVDMAGALRIGSYGIGFPKGFSVETAFRYATGGLYKDVWDKLIMSDPENLVPNDDAGIDRVLTKKYAFLAQDVYSRLDNIVPRPCDYVVLPKDYFTLSTAMGVTTGSPYKRIFNAYLLKMKDSGMMDKFRRNHVSQYSDCEQTGAQPLGIQNVFSGFMLVPFGVAMATVFLFIEFVCLRFSRTTDLKSSSNTGKQKEDLHALDQTSSNLPFQLQKFLSGNQPSGT